MSGRAQLTDTDVISRFRNLGITTRSYSDNRITSLFDTIRNNIPQRIRHYLGRFQSFGLRRTRDIPKYSHHASLPDSHLLRYSNENDNFLVFKIENNILTKTGETKDNVDINDICPHTSAFFPTKDGLMVTNPSYATDAYQAKTIKLQPHFGTSENAPAFSFPNYSVSTASLHFKANFLVKHKDLRSHILKWKADPCFPPHHNPILNAHLLDILPRKIRNRIQRIYIFNISVGHYHRHTHPASTTCPLCTLCIAANPHTETITHLFSNCAIARKIWKRIKNEIWTPATTARFPADTYSHTLGDISHLPKNPSKFFWTVIHTCFASRLYIERCNVLFGKYANPSWQLIVCNVVGALKSDISDAISASWAKRKAATSEKGYEIFQDCWIRNIKPNFLATTATIIDFDEDQQLYGPRHGHNTIKINFP